MASFELLNGYLGKMEPVIARHGGFIDKYVGDAVMSLFTGAVDGAVEAAVEMHHALAAFNEERPRRRRCGWEWGSTPAR